MSIPAFLAALCGIMSIPAFLAALCGIGLDTVLAFVIALGGTITVFGLIMLVRNHIVYAARQRLIARCGEAARRAAIEDGNFDSAKFFKPYDDMPSYESDLWDFGKWTVNDFLKPREKHP